jgi:SAM-dependent methyltransferase
MVDPELLDAYRYASRFEKAQKIERILKDFLGTDGDPRTVHCLDLGSSIGVISTRLAGTFGRVIGVEPLAEPSCLARRINPDSRATFLQGDGLHLPFGDEVFDVIVCAQVYEHSAYPQQLVAEIRRTLRTGGCCFFSGPNRLWPIEYHYNWFFLHWLPRALLNHYCQRQYAHDYDLILFNYWQLRSLWRDFESIDYTLRLIYEPGRFLDDVPLYRWVRIVPRSIASMFRFLLPNYNWVLVKSAVPSDG